jgi:hypothetical protein
VDKAKHAHEPKRLQDARHPTIHGFNFLNLHKGIARRARYVLPNYSVKTINMKNKSKLGFATCITSVLLSACATPFDSLREYKGQDHGYVVLSMGQPSGNIALPPSLTARRLGTPDLVLFEYPSGKRGSIAPDYESQASAGLIIEKKLPPGKYELYGFQIGNDGDPLKFSSQILAPVQFSVKTGETSYVGSYLISLKIQPGAPTKKDGQVVTVETSGLALNIDISDESLRDIRIATTRNKELASRKVTIDAQISNRKN